jgi:hypothetical protein
MCVCAKLNATPRAWHNQRAVSCTCKLSASQTLKQTPNLVAHLEICEHEHEHATIGAVSLSGDVFVELFLPFRRIHLFDLLVLVLIGDVPSQVCLSQEVRVYT